MDDCDLIEAIGLSKRIIGLSLKDQVKEYLQSGLMEHGAEYSVANIGQQGHYVVTCWCITL
jgi:hypothetical protein